MGSDAFDRRPAVSLTGKIALAGTVVALGSLIMSWLSEDEELWLDIAKWCGIAIVAVIALKLLALIFDA